MLLICLIDCMNIYSHQMEVYVFQFLRKMVQDKIAEKLEKEHKEDLNMRTYDAVKRCLQSRDETRRDEKTK